MPAAPLYWDRMLTQMLGEPLDQDAAVEEFRRGHGRIVGSALCTGEGGNPTTDARGGPTVDGAGRAGGVLPYERNATNGVQLR